jgi:AmmeMemoRadiSam system protein A
MDDVARTRLLALARQALEARVRGQCAPLVAADLNRQASGVFVTVHCRGELRGCLGTLDARERVGEAVARLAGDVSSEDVRFRPLSIAELDDVSIDVSVLTPAEVVHDPTSIDIGRDGLIVQQGSRKGLLLPQVATEHGWDRVAFLAQTCIKAGLPADAWQHGATVLRFQADVFGEADEATTGH